MATLRQLKALGLIARTGSFTKAAERLYISQSAVSVLMRELEVEVGRPLIKRGRLLQLTDAGEHLLKAGDAAAREIDRALKDIRDEPRLERQVLRVAAGSLSAATLVPMALSRLAALPDSPRVVLVDRPVGMLADVLLAREADLAVGSIDAHLRLSSELHSSLLLADELRVVCARANPLAGRALARGGIAWADLAQTPLVLMGRNGGQWDTLLREQLLPHDGLRVGHEVQLMSTALEFVRHDLGATVLPSMATRHLDPAAFAVSPLLGTSARWNTYCVMPREVGARAAAAELFIQALRDSLEEARIVG